MSIITLFRSQLSSQSPFNRYQTQDVGGIGVPTIGCRWTSIVPLQFHWGFDLFPGGASCFWWQPLLFNFPSAIAETPPVFFRVPDPWQRLFLHGCGDSWLYELLVLAFFSPDKLRIAWIISRMFFMVWLSGVYASVTPEATRKHKIRTNHNWDPNETRTVHRH